MATIKDVARLANVSPSTVSRVLANSPRISEETKRRVRAALEQLNYHPNAFARGLVTNSTGAIGILIPPSAEEFFVNPFFAEWMAGVAEVARQRGVDTVLSTSARGEIEMLDHMIRGRRVDGVLLIGTRRGDPVLKEISKLRCPAVLLGRPADPAHVSWVNNDNQRAAYDATLHLLNLGHRRIGFLGGASDLVVTMDRVAGYRNALVDYGVEPDPRLEVSSFFLEQGGYLGMMRLLAISDRPTAVLCADDVLAFGGMRAAHELGFEVPRDLAIVGFNDIRLAELAHPALTSVRVHMHELGVRSAGLLLEEIDQGKPLQRHVIVNHELVIRYSCGAKPIGTLTT
ncbi:LacI family DNA-binding transcriptional regulator [Alicyclobacillus mali]|uniref:LacI family DNA-binding transcriptional regulator n=1 Tax=Alicyclobacillus mali (ex Roth et al. 2021) TaxID=1123961 RepID=A0ABS0F206_9BACL|nr:LacI family DNA-binding transcriptional regulator [Alicyclobacillus mali (ex Roth et al. 2021)]MBF8377306.1 LacI family DNA-binding transcriptional regulator [Alicyclobacillus mali (ex Roth et al. 2021)]